MEGKSALIFGAARGIGRAVAQEFVRRGARVALADIDKAGADEAAAAIVAADGEAVAVQCDVLNDTSVQGAAVAAEQALGDIDIVMNNVGGILRGYPEDIPIAEWDRMMNLNFMSAVRSNAYFIPRMIARGRGHIVNTASVAGLYPFAFSRIPYAAAKAAMIAMSGSLAVYLHPKGVRVSCFCVGPVITGIADKMKTWSNDAPMIGPGSNLAVLTAEQAATVLADGMDAGRVLIPTHEEFMETLRQYAASPEAFIQMKIDEIAGGDDGRPNVLPPGVVPA